MDQSRKRAVTVLVSIDTAAMYSPKLAIYRRLHEINDQVEQIVAPMDPDYVRRLINDTIFFHFS